MSRSRTSSTLRLRLRPLYLQQHRRSSLFENLGLNQKVIPPALCLFVPLFSRGTLANDLLHPLIEKASLLQQVRCVPSRGASHPPLPVSAPAQSAPLDVAMLPRIPVLTRNSHRLPLNPFRPRRYPTLVSTLLPIPHRRRPND